MHQTFGFIKGIGDSVSGTILALVSQILGCQLARDSETWRIMARFDLTWRDLARSY